MGRTAHGIPIEREERGAQERERRGGGGASRRTRGVLGMNVA